MLSNCFDYIFVHLRQKARLRPELNPKFLSTLGPNPTRKARADLQLCGPTYNSVAAGQSIKLITKYVINMYVH